MRAQERVATAQAEEQAQRAKRIEIIRAEEVAEKDAIGIRVAAKAEREAAEDRAQAIEAEARSRSNAEKLAAEGTLARYEADAAGQMKINEAANALTPAVIEMRLREALLTAMPGIVASLVEPMKHIDSIKVVDVSGFGNHTSNGQDGANQAAAGSLPDQVVNAALRHSASKPLLESLMREIGIADLTATGLAAPVQNMMARPAVDAKGQPVKPAAN